MSDEDLAADKGKGLPKRSRPQELARRMGYENWKQPSHIYWILDGTRKVIKPEWVNKCAEALSILPYYLYEDDHIRQVFAGIVDELNNTKYPEVLVARLTGQKVLRKEYRDSGFSLLDKGKTSWVLREERTEFKEKKMPASSSDSMYEVICNDPAMIPSIPKGSVLHIDPSAKFESGNLYYVVEKTGQEWIRLVFASEDSYILQAADTDLEHPFVVSMNNIANIHRVVKIHHS